MEISCSTGAIQGKSVRIEMTSSIMIGLIVWLGLFAVSPTAFAQNNSNDPSPGGETPGYITVVLDRTTVAITKPVSGSATVYEADGSADTDDTIKATPDDGDDPVSGTGSISFSFATYSPGGLTIVGTTDTDDDKPDSKTAQVKMPTGENALWHGFDFPDVTLGGWGAQALPTDVDFSGVPVMEEDAGGGEDTCHFPDSKYPSQTTISHGQWVIGSDNLFEVGEDEDLVGWVPDYVNYYQSQARSLPCHFTHYQKMEVVLYPNPKSLPFPVYTTNTLRGEIQPSGVTSEKSGESHFNEYYQVVGSNP